MVKMGKKEQLEKNKKKMKIINQILNILLIILLIVGVYLFAARIFGNSPTDFQLITWVSGFFITAMLKMFGLIYSLNREIGEIKIGIKNSFEKIKIDMEEIKNKLG